MGGFSGRATKAIVVRFRIAPMPGTDPPRECDVVVVGAGIVGLAAARELALRHDGLRVVVLEREARIVAHQSGRTSGVIHAGIYYRLGSLKARPCGAGPPGPYAYRNQPRTPTARHRQAR